MVGSAGDRFWKDVEFFGPPARDYRWCCKVLKLGPLRRAISPMAPGVTLVGQRRRESASRSRSPRVWVNRWLPEFRSAAPLNDWSSLAVWLYAELRSVRLNPLYQEGFERLGCYLCPSMRLADLHRLRSLHPDLAGRWEDWLRRYAAERGYGEEWVRYGLWRWVRVPERLSSAVGGRGFYPRLGAVAVESEGRLSLLPNVDLGDLSRTVGSKLGLLSPEDPSARLLVTAALRSAYCTGCGLCADYCPEISVEGSASVGGECSGCGLCNLICPLSLHARHLSLIHI